MTCKHPMRFDNCTAAVQVGYRRKSGHADGAMGASESDPGCVRTRFGGQPLRMIFSVMLPQCTSRRLIAYKSLELSQKFYLGKEHLSFHAAKTHT